ncbi:unnamed protein product, partial [Mesorhabditis belari]|uniref:Uncharacterized protein n=1 Tax=Mesorhabditis belari TaxID=2138241 RepID=A0AAF3EL74_9BILA
MGLVCWEIIERRTVFSKYGLHDFNQFALFNDLSHDRFTLPQVDCVHPIREIIASCTNFYHEKRPDARSVYKKVCEYNSTYKDFEFTPCFGPGTALLRPIGFDGTNMEVAVEMGGDGEEESLPSSTSTTLYHTIPRGSIKKREASISTGGFEKRSTKAQRKSWTEIVFPSFLKLLFSRGHGPP